MPGRLEKKITSPRIRANISTDHRTYFLMTGQRICRRDLQGCVRGLKEVSGRLKEEKNKLINNKSLLK